MIKNAWPYRCTDYFSPLQIIDKCYVRIPRMYKKNILLIQSPETHKVALKNDRM